MKTALVKRNVKASKPAGVKTTWPTVRRLCDESTLIDATVWYGGKDKALAIQWADGAETLHHSPGDVFAAIKSRA